MTDDNNKTQEDTRLIISSLRALWGLVTPHLRSVSVEMHDNTIFWQCIFDKDATESDLGFMSEAFSEVIADFHADRVKENIQIIPFPEKTGHLKNLIYLRHE
jgi:hypothetical protein